MSFLSRHSATGTLVFIWMVAAGCSVVQDNTPARTEARSVELDKADSVRVELKFGAGELAVRGGSAKLMDADFTFTRETMRPEISYDATGTAGHLRIVQPSGPSFNNSKYRWDVRLNDGKPIDLDVSVGAGECQFDLGTLTLRSLTMRMGAGELRLDLRGTPKADYAVSLEGGVGEATVYLPQGVGVTADVRGGIGDVSVQGLEKRDGRYVNSAYGQAKTTIRLDIRGGVGSIKLIG